MYHYCMPANLDSCSGGGCMRIYAFFINLVCFEGGAATAGLTAVVVIVVLVVVVVVVVGV